MNRCLFALFTCLFALQVFAQSPGQQLEPRQHFPSPILDIYSPDAEGWIFAGAGSNGLSFAKRGAVRDETYAAQVILFDFPPTDSDEEFVEFVKQRIAEMNPAPRFRELVSDYQYNGERGYPCVDVNMAFLDTEAVISGGTGELTLKVIARYCRHPEIQEIGFFAAYSYRGKQQDPGIEPDAESFIAAVTVPES